MSERWATAALAGGALCACRRSPMIRWRDFINYCTENRQGARGKLGILGSIWHVILPPCVLADGPESRLTMCRICGATGAVTALLGKIDACGRYL